MTTTTATTCTVHLPDSKGDFGWVHCGQPADDMPEIGAGHGICTEHQHDERIIIRDYRGATVIELANECDHHDPADWCRSYRGIRYHVTPENKVSWASDWHTLYGLGLHNEAGFSVKSYGPSTYGHTDLFVA